MKTAIMYIMAFSAGLIWGITFSLARIATDAGFHPLGLAWWQAAGGGTVLLVYCIIRKEYKNPKPRIIDLGAIALSGNVIPGTALFYAALYVPAGVLAITIAIVPMATYAMSVCLSLDRFTQRRAVGVMLGFVSILLIMLPGSFEGLSAATSTSLFTDPRFWIGIALFAGVNYTIENLYVDARVPANQSIPLLLSGSMLLAAVLLLPVIIASATFVRLTPPFNTAEWSIIAMMFVSAIAYLMYLLLIQMAGAVFASMSGYVVTLSGVVWGMIIFGEEHTFWVWVALALMILGMALVTPRQEN